MNDFELINGKYYWVLTKTSPYTNNCFEIEYKSLEYCKLSSTTVDFNIDETVVIFHFTIDEQVILIHSYDVENTVFHTKDDYLKYIISNTDETMYEAYNIVSTNKSPSFISKKIKESQHKNPEIWI